MSDESPLGSQSHLVTGQTLGTTKGTGVLWAPVNSKPGLAPRTSQPPSELEALRSRPVGVNVQGSCPSIKQHVPWRVLSWEVEGG